MRTSLRDLRRALCEAVTGPVRVEDVVAALKPFKVRVTDVVPDQLSLSVPIKAWSLDQVNDRVEDIDDVVVPLGWFVAERTTSLPAADIRRKRESPSFFASLQPKVGIEVEVPRTLYHVTTIGNARAIRSSGLVPQHGADQQVGYGPRTYLVTKKLNVGDVAGDLAKRFVAARGLAIVVVHRPDGARFYRDPEFGSNDGFVYTVDPIGPESVDDLIEVPLTGDEDWKDVRNLADDAAYGRQR
jgi:hypothetical protein